MKYNPCDDGDIGLNRSHRISRVVLLVVKPVFDKSGSFCFTSVHFSFRVLFHGSSSAWEWLSRAMRNAASMKPVLLVENHANDLELALYALRESRLANPVDVVREGEEALDYLVCRGKYAQCARIAPALILLDLQMPKVSGIEVLQILRLTPNLRHIPVVATSTSTSTEDEDFLRTSKLGIEAYVVKPLCLMGFSVAVAQLGLSLAASDKGSVSGLYFNIDVDAAKGEQQAPSCGTSGND